MTFSGIVLRASLLAFLASTVGCAEDSTDHATDASESALGREGVGRDVQVLQIWTPGRFIPKTQRWFGVQSSDVTIDAATACTAVRTWKSTGYESAEVDCARAFEKAAPFDVTREAGPTMTPVKLVVTKRTSDGYVFVDPDYCNRVEVRIVVRDAAGRDASFAGIGFWTSAGETFTAKADLQAVGATRLASGEAATVYRFTGLSTCVSGAHSSTSGNIYNVFSFKPYAAYDANGVRHRVWEDLSGNHAIGRSWPGATPVVNATGFDRQRELLAP